MLNYQIYLINKILIYIYKIFKDHPHLILYTEFMKIKNKTLPLTFINYSITTEQENFIQDIVTKLPFPVIIQLTPINNKLKIASIYNVESINKILDK